MLSRQHEKCQMTGWILCQSPNEGKELAPEEASKTNMGAFLAFYKLYCNKQLTSPATTRRHQIISTILPIPWQPKVGVARP